jgi:hypothetical protein
MLGVFGYYLWRHKRGYRRPKGRGLRGVVRLIGYGVGMSVVLGATAFHSAKADIGQATLSIGRDLMPLANELGETTKIKLNGESLFLGNALLEDESVNQVLDRFEAHCKDNQGPWAALWSQMDGLKGTLSKAKDKSGKELGDGSLPVSKDGVFRQGDSDHGAVMCFTKWEGSINDYQEAYRQFAKTGDFGRLGKLRYAFAAKTANGNTHVLTAFTDGSLNLNKIIPPDTGDAPGDETTLAPRPPNSRRILAASVEGTPYGIHVYQTESEPSAVLAHYDDTMQKAGWQPIIPATPNEFATMRTYSKGALEVVLTATRGSNGTSVGIGELGAGDNANVPASTSSP